MHTITLSDHTQDMVANAAASRAQAYETDQRNYLGAIERRTQITKQYRKALSDAWADKSFWRILVGVWRVLFGPLPTHPAAPVQQSAGRDEIVWATGGEGERKVADHLGRQLNDEWTLVCGYRNPKGEIDQVLVGPSGVFAIEIKFVNGTVQCDGDRWWRDKFDKYGNLVEQNVPIADKRGRSPSRQLNEAADQLQSFLDRNFGEGRVSRAIVLAHESSQEGFLSRVQVDMVATLANFDVAKFVGTERGLDGLAVQAVLAAIRKDHAFHATRLRHRGDKPHQ